MADEAYGLPIPVADAASQEFFDGARQGKLMLLRCTKCGSYRLPGRELCSDCWSTDSEWARASGRGKLYTFGIMHQKYHPAFAEVIPYNYATVELEEGPRIVSNIVECDDEDLRIDMPVEAVFDAVSDEITLIRFRPLVQ